MQEEAVLRAASRSLERLLRETLEAMGSDEFREVIHGIEEAVLLDVSKAYFSAITSAVERWVSWAHRCQDAGGGTDLCREVEEEVRAVDRGIGAVSYFNRIVKSLFVRAYRDLSPAVLIPRWVIFYAGRIGVHLLHELRGLSPGEQLLRLPHLASTIYTVRQRIQALSSRYPVDSIAGATLAYIDYDLLEPAYVLPAALARLVGLDPRQLRGKPDLDMVYRAYSSAVVRQVLRMRARIS